MRIEICPSKINECGDDIIEIGTEIDDLVRNLEVSIDKVNDAWDDIASEAFVGTMREKYVTDLRKLIETINEHGTFLKNAQNEYVECDNDFAARTIL